MQSRQSDITGDMTDGHFPAEPGKAYTLSGIKGGRAGTQQRGDQAGECCERCRQN